MKLLTKELENRFRKVGSQESRGDEAVVIAKFFTLDSSWTWLAEFDPETREFFGLVDGHEVELGYFSLDELQASKGPLGLTIERDKFWKEQTLREVRSMIELRMAS